MKPNSVFNLTVCILGVLILFVHVVNILLKKDRRKDENKLLLFFVFTVFHFFTYAVFTLLKDLIPVQNNTYIITFYTIFYIMNNIEMLLFFNYFMSYAPFQEKTNKIVTIINLSLFAVFVISDIANIFLRFYFTAKDGLYVRQRTMILSQGYQFIMLAVTFILIIVNKRLNMREKIAFSLYVFLPLASILLQNRFAGYAIAYATLLLSVEILFLFLNVEKNVELKEEQEKLKDANIRIMVSQIQPHFIYNTLSSISTLIHIDPEKAQQALDDFANYLRMNFSTLTETKTVPFEDELKHIETYVNLEKMRFNDRLHVVFDIKAKDFDVPPLSIQPLVENAIKHGVLKKVEGGTVFIKTLETKDAYIVEIIDDGVGFDMNSIDFNTNFHIGLKNVKYRIDTMSHGSVIFNSTVNKGTTVIVTFYK